MSAMPSPAQSKRYTGLLPVDLSIEGPAVCRADKQHDRFLNPRAPGGTQASLTLSRLLITFCIGVAAILAWQSYGDAAKEIIANSSPNFGWFAVQAAPAAQNAPNMIAPAVPTASSHDQQLVRAVPPDFDAVRQSVDRIATSQRQILRMVDQLAVRQEQIEREVTKLQAISQYILYKNSEPPQPTTGRVPTPVPRPSQVRMAR